jgi:hypothetical protein
MLAGGGHAVESEAREQERISEQQSSADGANE